MANTLNPLIRETLTREPRSVQTALRDWKRIETAREMFLMLCGELSHCTMADVDAIAEFLGLSNRRSVYHLLNMYVKEVQRQREAA